ncbi:unknown protein [Oryza sativa Japonica Group]|uniref:Os01g0174200 protein n=2 Tax=Oryza sativa subsp. japonica TaxID=39947 RepID=Q5VR09_ORYSJ|nr:hypothetical protein EE612_000536 [Oryza sativa]BAD68118.1 unknown protein [Oryza sativa Japonica Group]BAF04076.1 Os01g0174200 [Oryza sativa Japonica Group]BAH00383.1 unnamed protein product [Oryza sativa Japonica Group]BAS70653.1 Os01g0174200 [Oryza sativa Japonica Group]|eukprot:NP_001042162.1 Os01g0174200 [Oryza sativa Japonica Group]
MVLCRRKMARPLVAPAAAWSWCRGGTRDRRRRWRSGCRRRRGGGIWNWNHVVASRRGFGFLFPLLGWDSCGKRGEKKAARFGLLRARVWGIGGQLEPSP